MRTIAILLVSASFLAATPALAQRNGAWYVGGDFGGMIVEDIPFDFQIAPGVPTAGTLTLNHDYGYDGALFVGYDLGAFRLEAEAAYKHADLESFSNSAAIRSTGTPHPVGIHPAGGGSTSALSFMINGLLDFGDDDGISGFVGGGVGIARVTFNEERAFATTGTFLDDHDTRFAWQVVAGVRQAISDNIDVTLRYRFFNVRDIRVKGVTDLPIDSGRFRSHSILGGLTFNFGAPPPPPPPTPTPVVEVVAPPTPPEPPVPPAPMVAPGPFMVFFDWDMDTLTPQAAAILDNAASEYQRSGSANLVLAGHADRSGADAYNVGLSQRRAQNVSAYLVGRGVPAGVITTEAFGESRPLVDTADGVREPQNRRVEISFGPGSGW